jgi:hypothetical protein
VLVKGSLRNLHCPRIFPLSPISTTHGRKNSQTRALSSVLWVAAYFRMGFNGVWSLTANSDVVVCGHPFSSFEQVTVLELQWSIGAETEFEG